MFFHGGTPACENEYKERRQFVAHGDFSNIASCQVKISMIFKYLEFLAAFQDPPNCDLWNHRVLQMPGSETLF
jgi:hypothetical protein